MKNLQQMQQIMKQVQQIQEQLQKHLDDLVVEASAGGGMVTVRMNGQKHLVAVRVEHGEARAPLDEAEDPPHVHEVETIVLLAGEAVGIRGLRREEDALGPGLDRGGRVARDRLADGFERRRHRVRLFTQIGDHTIARELARDRQR